MLVISRKPGESILISDQIRITVLSQSSDKVTIGIDAPKDVRIIREELADTIEANQASSEKIGQTEFQGIADLLKNNKNNRKK